METKPVEIKLFYQEKSGKINLVMIDNINKITISAQMDADEAEGFINDFTIACYEAKKEINKQ